MGPGGARNTAGNVRIGACARESANSGPGYSSRSGWRTWQAPPTCPHRAPLPSVVTSLPTTRRACVQSSGMGAGGLPCTGESARHAASSPCAAAHRAPARPPIQRRSIPCNSLSINILGHSTATTSGVRQTRIASSLPHRQPPRGTRHRARPVRPASLPRSASHRAIDTKTSSPIPHAPARHFPPSRRRPAAHRGHTVKRRHHTSIGAGNAPHTEARSHAVPSAPRCLRVRGFQPQPPTRSLPRTPHR